MKLELDDWQKKVLETKGNICLRSGRQVGKSTIIGIKAADYALKNKDKLIMIISKTERQASLLFSKVLFNLNQTAPNQILTGKNRPTKHLINLKNGSKIYSLPAGDTGFGIMGFTIDLLIADEAAFIPEEVWNSIVPALAITRGEIWLLSTPYVKKGYYYNCFNDESFTNFHQSTEDCPRKDVEFLKHQKEILTKAQYAQMYLGLFVDEIKQFFSDELISECCSGKRTGANKTHTNILGVDVAGMGEDESTFEILDFTSQPIKQVDNLITTKTRTTETANKIKQLERQYNFKKIFIDDAGMGVGVFDQLLEFPETKRKTIGINNSKRSIEHLKDGKKKRLIKEDLYNNLLRLMERREIVLLDDDEIKASLKSVQAEEVNGNLKINGTYTHIAEGLIRAAWYAKSKSLNNFIM